jgi:hypothetical protein
VDDVLDADEPDDGVEEVDGVDEVDVPEEVVASDDVVDPASFLVSPEPLPAAGAEAVLADARESVL